MSAAAKTFDWDTPSKPQPKPAALRQRLFVSVALVVGISVLALALSMLFGRTDPPKHKSVVQISLLPPPPPPKPKEEPPPKPKEVVKLEPPTPTPQPPTPTPQAPPPGPLGVDAAGNGPGDGFGLAARPGGRDIIVGGGGGGGLNRTLFGTNAARQIAQDLARNPRLKDVVYKIDIRVWVSKDGRLEREEIVRGTGDRELDALIREGLRQISALRTPVPDNLPQPLRIRVTSTDA